MFYKNFQEKRKELGLTLEQISQKIKISVDNLRNIESGDFSQLPDLYIRLFIKTYAQELGFNPDEYLKKYEEHTGSKKHEILKNIGEDIPEKEPLKINSPFNQMSDRSKLITIAVTLVMLIFVIIIVKQVLSEKETQSVSSVHQRIMEQDSLLSMTNNVDTEANDDPVKDEEDQPEETPEILPSKVETEEAVNDSSGLLTLNIEINDTCWVKIVLDEIDTSEALFRPGATREWTASEVFDLRIGRPEVVSLYLNGTKLDSVDYGIAPARLVITKDGIINR